MTKATLYGKKNCSFCDKAMKLLSEMKFDVNYNDVDISLVKAELLELVPMAKTVPQIWINDSYVGGYDDLVELLKRWKNSLT